MALTLRPVNNKENLLSKTAVVKGGEIEKRPALTFIENKKAPNVGVKRSNCLRSQVLVKEASRVTRVLKESIFEDTTVTSKHISTTTIHVENSKQHVSVISNVSEEPETTVTSFSSRQLPDNVEDIDNDRTDIMLCSQYAFDIYEYLKERELELPINDSFMKNQKHVTVRMRKILVDWIVQVHDRFELMIETLYLSVSIIDRFLEKEVIVKDEFQLLGITALLLASKYEEMYFPPIAEFVYVTDKTYNKKQVIEMEMRILAALDFQVGRPLPIQFLRRISRAANTDLRIHATAKYYMELSLIDKDLVCESPSLVAAAAFFLANKLQGSDGGGGVWNEQLVYYSGYEENDLITVVRRLCVGLLSSETSKKKAISLKYLHKKRMRVSNYTSVYLSTIRSLAKVY